MRTAIAILVALAVLAAIAVGALLTYFELMERREDENNV